MKIDRIILFFLLLCIDSLYYGFHSIHNSLYSLKNTQVHFRLERKSEGQGVPPIRGRTHDFSLHLRRKVLDAIEEMRRNLPKDDDEDDEPAPQFIYSNKRPIKWDRIQKITARRKAAALRREEKEKLKVKPKRKDRGMRNRTIKKHRQFQEIVEATSSKRDLNNPHEIAPPLKEDKWIPFIETCCLAADSRKVNYMHVVRVFYLTESRNFVIIFEGNSKAQLHAIAEGVEKSILEKFGRRPDIKELPANSGWLSLDYGEVTVQMMTPAMRSYYKLENLWKEGEVLDMNYLFPQRPELVRNGLNTEYEPSPSSEFDGITQFGYRRKPSSSSSSSTSSSYTADEMGEEDPFWK